METAEDRAPEIRLTSVCVITSIFPPNAAVRSFADAREFDAVLVVGDRKSPESYSMEGVRFIALREQIDMRWRIAAGLPQNHYARKMLGYLEAANGGADIIFDTDDDNKLIEGRQGDIWQTQCNLEIGTACPSEPYVNIYRHFTAQAIWPRGLPLDLVLASSSGTLKVSPLSCAPAIGVWQGLANGDPDVDAIYRLTSNASCIFDDAPSVVLSPGSVCPFNSQNTAFRRELLPLMYLPAFVSFRYTDILRGLVAQPVLWAAGLRLCFTAATVFQERNAHDYMRDFESEVPMYLTCRQALETAVSVARDSMTVGENVHAVYSALERCGIVTAGEVRLLEAWLQDCETALSHRTSC